MYNIGTYNTYTDYFSQCAVELIDEGKIKYVGLSEAPPDIIRRAHKVVPISAVQQEWSLIVRDLEEKGGIIDTCRELGIGIVPYRYILLYSYIYIYTNF